MSRMRDLLIKRRSEMTPLIHWDFSGKSNADAGTIIKDLTGNGYDLELKNFAFDNESGYNGYPQDFRKANQNSNITSKSENIITFSRKTDDFSLSIPKVYYNNISYVMRVHLPDGVETVTLSAYVGPNHADYGLSKDRETFTFYEGINIVPAFSSEFFDNCQYIGYAISKINTDKEAIIEIFPLYPDQLIFNKNKAYTVKHVKINTTRGFTAIIRRQFIQEDIKTVVLGQQGNSGRGSDFYIRDYKPSADGEWMVYNFGMNNTIYSHDPTGDLMWSTLSKFFNGQVVTIHRPSLESPDDAPLILGNYNYNSTGEGNFAVREVYIFDRDLTQSQIEKFISDNMIPLPEVYYDVEKQGTLNEHTTKDKLIDFSGNQHHGTLHNFTFDESNGWGYYNDDVKAIKDANIPEIKGSYSYSNYKLHITSNISNTGNPVLVLIGNINGVEGESLSYTRKDIKFRITGLTNSGGQSFFINKYINDGEKSSWINLVDIIYTDGIYTVPGEEIVVEAANTGIPKLIPFRFGIISGVPSDNLDITVEFLPDYGDCLRFKDAENIGDTGTYVDSFYNTGFKTIFLLVDNDDVAESGYFYDQRYKENPEAGDYHFGLYYGSTTQIAYQYRNAGVTYINGELNTTINSATLKGKRCITIVDNVVDYTNSQSPIIGSQLNHTYTSNMKLYKFLGFKKALSEKQIKMVIEKYGLQIITNNK